MNSKLNYAIALLRSIASVRQMFERIAYNLNFEYHCRKLREISDKPFISFVIPTKNEAWYLPKVLISINYIALVCKVPIETVVVDYRSEDGTPDIARKMGAKVVEADKPGVGYASYLGVLSTKGDIIIRTDADAIMTPSAIYETTRIFTNNPKKLVTTVGHIYYPLNLATNLVAYLYDYYVRTPCNTTGYFIAFRRSILDKVNFDIDLKVHEDYNFGERACRNFGLRSMHLNQFVTVLVSSRLIRKKGLSRYLLDRVGVFKSDVVSYSQLVTQYGY
jgi:glycosyltransferase involved in cell wall biosynthesis